MFKFLLAYIYVLATLEFCPFFWNFLDFGLNMNKYTLYVLFSLIFFLSYSFFEKKELFNNNNDLMFRFLRLLFLVPSKFITYVVVEIKKFFLFSWFFKFYHSITTNRIFFGKKFSNIFVIWRPLFKRWSYFGYYRSNRSKWIK